MFCFKITASWYSVTVSVSDLDPMSFNHYVMSIGLWPLATVLYCEIISTAAIICAILADGTAEGIVHEVFFML